MGWASLIEDVVKRFDAEERWSFPSLRFGKPPSAKASLERMQLDREAQATKIAVHVFQQNERKIAKLKTESDRLEQQLAEANRELQNWKNKLTEAAKANEQLNRRLGSYRAKFARRITLLMVNEDAKSADSLDSLMGKIEQFKETNLRKLDKEARAKFDMIASYALSEKKVKQQELKIETQNRKLAETKQEIQSLKSFYDQVEKRRRALSSEAKSYEGWEIMDEWLKKNSIVSPKEESDSPVPKKIKKTEVPVFNPVFKEATDFHA
jgi:DNA repair exonuclease SbcCD ATPase subunit